ncbi:MAG: pilus assembly protein PilE [Polaromonas sp. 39-63-203]|jgi:type IV pilus assembly protein PilE|uniref:type IV pilin protein n=1 Tax=Polaromonas sp. TaxID=1869339 RepID=UPI000BD8AEBD|nr:type IV pilin protein [Polaromonas sp.]OYY52454.1 MAG: pilus assembly protein PilE [Polaromonas sp. 35-63-240]OYZ84012.1 MAG: pilus assembly protein PilE [Polaromonas sp. 24-62-144]OZA98705.1 MAG: pilus assembly protein PilE [Polaromonas sp. 39-63-203]HQS30701.1 type IV pilin protein [Polaromonas sp.]
MTNKTSRGFTLIELMIVVAIVAIITSIAYPSYRDSVLKGKRAEGRAALTELLQQQERYMTQRNVYLEFTNVGGTTTPASVPFKTFSGDSSAKSAYYLQSTACATGVALSECVMVEAIPVSSGSDPEAGTLRVFSTGVKTCTGSKQSVCWK